MQGPPGRPGMPGPRGPRVSCFYFMLAFRIRHIPARRTGWYMTNVLHIFTEVMLLNGGCTI